MLRHAVTVWFLLATLLGPKACCCSLIATLAARPRAAKAAPAPEHRCCEEKKSEPRRPEAPAPTDCPCKAAHDWAALQVPAAEPGIATDRACTLALDVATPPAITSATSGLLTPADVSPPFLKPCDLLPILRC